MAVTDILASLVGPSWRAIPFPLVHLRTSGGNDLVEHKRPDVDGYHVESTGGNNKVIEATIPFRNNIRPAPSEKWGFQVLYPDVFRAFVAACADKSTGALLHPELGQLHVKCRRFSWSYDANRRDGCDLDVEWVESLDTGELFETLTSPSPVAVCITLATELDDQISTLVPPPPELEEDPVSFEEMMRSLTAIPDTATLLSKQIGGVFTRIADKIDRLEQAMARFNTVRYWPIVDGLEHMRAAVFDMQRKFSVDQKVIREYIVLVPATLPTLAQLLAQDIDDMIRLNRDKLEKPVIEVGSRVKYYKKVA